MKMNVSDKGGGLTAMFWKIILAYSTHKTADSWTVARASPITNTNAAIEYTAADSIMISTTVRSDGWPCVNRAPLELWETLMIRVAIRREVRMTVETDKALLATLRPSTVTAVKEWGEMEIPNQAKPVASAAHQFSG
jgi:hypothetical protein